MRLQLAVLCLGLGALGCSPKPALIGPVHTLELRADPPAPASLAPGMIVRVAAVPVPATEMQWVSGTVKLFGAPTLAFRKDPEDGFYKFKTMVPPMVDVPPGFYEVKAWGRTAAGEAVEGHLNYEVR